VSRYYTGADWRTASLVFLVALGVYCATLAPTITLEYSGQLVVAADHAGVARPPGYPVWHLLAKAFTTLFSFVEYRAHPNPAWAVNFLSALLGALSCGTLALLVSRETRALAGDTPAAESRDASLARASAAFAAALLFGFCPAMWSQSVIAETHTLTNFHLLALMAVLLRWVQRREERSIHAVSLLFGLGVSISPLLVLLAPVMLLAASLVSRRAVLTLATATGLFLSFIGLEFVLGHRSPAAAALLLVGFLGTILGLWFRPCTRAVSCPALLMLAGLLPYLYLPVAAAGHPPMNMGYACTWEGFWHVLSRGQYEALSPLNPFTHAALFGDQLRAYASLAVAQFTAPILAVALVPVAILPRLRRPARRSLAVLLTALFLFSVVTLLGAHPSVDVQTLFAARLLFIPSFALLAILIGYGLVLVLDRLRERDAQHGARDNRQEDTHGRPRPDAEAEEALPGAGGAAR
jgi:hypothetical protein